jgi:hypothetical protein
MALAIVVGKSSSHSMVTFAGHVILGGVVSTIVTFWVQLALLPQASTTVQDL